MTKRLLLGAALALLLMFSQASPVLAAGPASPSGARSLVSVAPFLQTVNILPTDAVKNFDVQITNDSQNNLSFHLSVVDFGSLDETGGLVFAGSNASSLTKKYGLAPWLQLATSDLNLAPHQTAKVTATIVNDAHLQPGGHYAAIITSVKNSGAAGSNQVSVKQELSSLVLATKVGGAKYDLHLNSVRYGSGWWRLPQTVTLRFYNPGNVHVVPRGLVKLIAPNGQVVSQGTINEASAFALPETYRQIPVELQSVGHGGWRPGLYHLQVDYRYDGLDRFASRTFTVRFLNLSSALTLVVILAVVVWLAVKMRRRKGQKRPPAKQSAPAKKSVKIVIKDSEQ